MRRVLASVWLFVGALVLVIVVVALAAPTTSTSAQRVAHLESLIRCPACEDISVAQSNAPSSVAVRHEISQRVSDGQSDNEIIAALEGAYGNNILLSPRGSALDSLLWIVPAAVVASAVVIGVRLVRRHT